MPPSHQATDRPSFSQVAVLSYQILSNPIYIGQVRHHGKTYDGEHEAILPQKLWDQVQSKLAEKAARPKGVSA